MPLKSASSGDRGPAYPSPYRPRSRHGHRPFRQRHGKAGGPRHGGFHPFPATVCRACAARRAALAADAVVGKRRRTWASSWSPMRSSCSTRSPTSSVLRRCFPKASGCARRASSRATGRRSTPCSASSGCTRARSGEPAPECYLMAEDMRSGLLSWVIVDYLSDTISYDRAHGLRAPSAPRSVVTTTCDGRVLVDVQDAESPGARRVRRAAGRR